MMHRCSSSQGSMVGQCTCGLYHSQSNSFSMLFPMPNHHISFDETDMYPFTAPSSSVDCTLSLGTPSTRLCEDDEKRIRHESRTGSCMSNFCWDILQNNKNTPYPPQPPKTSRGSNSNSNNNLANNDPLLARRCANCDTTSTPLWRNGPRGPKVVLILCHIKNKYMCQWSSYCEVLAFVLKICVSSFALAISPILILYLLILCPTDMNIC